MAEKPPRYDSIPLYDIEEHSAYDYDGASEDGPLTEDDIKFREELAYIANLPPDFEPHEHRRILCFVLAFVTVLSFTLSLFLSHHDPSTDAAYVLPLNRSAAYYEHLHTLQIESGGSISLYSIDWDSKPGVTEKTYVCQFESICVQRHHDNADSTSGDGGAAAAPYNEYWLMGQYFQTTSSVERYDTLAVDGFNRCLGNPQSDEPKSRLLGIKSVASLDGEVKWMYGSTLGFIKQASTLAGFGNAVEWLQAWSRLMSLGIDAPDFLNEIRVSTKHFFRHIMFLHQDLSDKATAWHDIFLRTSYAAASSNRPKSFLSSIVSSSAKLVIRTRNWMDRNMPTHTFADQKNLKVGETTCYERMVMLAPSKQFFRDTTDAEFFRKSVLNEGDVELERRLPSERRDVKAILLLRADRPMWDSKRLVNILHEAGVRDVRVTAVTEHTSYQTHLDLWSTADLVISDDHDALTGQTLMHPNTGVIEVFPPLTFSDEHALLAEKTGVHYVGLKSHPLVPAEIVEKREPTATPALQHAQSFFDKKVTAHDCQTNKECSLAMYGIGAYIESQRFSAAVEDLLRKVVLPRPLGCMEE